MDERMPLVLLLTTVVVISRMFEDEEGIGIGIGGEAEEPFVANKAVDFSATRTETGRMRECVFVVSLNLPRT